MVTITKNEREVLLYLKAVRDRNITNAINSQEIADNIDMPIKDVNDACRSLSEKHLVEIDKWNTKKDVVNDVTVHIIHQGQEFLQNVK